MNKILVTAIGAFTILSAIPAPADEGPSEGTYEFRSSRAAGALDHVAVVLEVAGDLLEKNDAKLQRVAMNGTCSLSYDERTINYAAAADGKAAAVRYYDQTEASIKAGNDSTRPTLGPERRLLGIVLAAPKSNIFAPQGPQLRRESFLSRSELDMVDVLGNSLLLDWLLPEGRMAVGQKRPVADNLVLMLLSLDELRQNSVQVLLKEVTPDLARWELNGKASGVVNGVSTEIELKAKFRYDRHRQRIDWFAMLVKEKREISLVEHGFDVVARVQVQVTPQADSPHLSDAVVKELAMEPAPAALQLIYAPPATEWSILHDRRWFLTDRRRELYVLRLLDQGAEVAMCKITPLPPAPAAKRPTLKRFQEDVQRALGTNFGAFLETEATTNDEHCEVFRTVVRGTVSEVPIQWHYYLVVDPAGRQAAFAFTVEEKRLPLFAKAGADLVASLRFTPAKTPEKAKR